MTTSPSYDAGVRLLALSLYAGVGPRLFDHLVQRFGSVDEIFLAERAELERIDGLPASTITALDEVSRHLDQAAQLQTVLSARGISVIHRYDPKYPASLLELNDPPLVLFVRGVFSPPFQPALGLLGPTIPTQAGLAFATALVRYPALQTVTLITSLRGGTDAALILGAGPRKTPVIAITDTPIDQPLSPERLKLQEILLATESPGAIVTEFLKSPATDQPLFAPANRLIAGLASGVAILECHAGDDDVLDMISCCQQLGKLCFLLESEQHPGLIDPAVRSVAVRAGAVPMSAERALGELIRVLV